jgi:hypothetical protein
MGGRVCKSWLVSDKSLQPTDPVSEGCHPAMALVIAEEIAARLAVRDNAIDDPTWPQRVANVAADALLDAFRVRPIAHDERRWIREA